jgi:sugar lactone lactonase YvrE
MISKKNIALTALALLASVSTASAQTLLWSDNFDDDMLTGWTPGTAWQVNEINHQFVVSENFGPMQTNNPTATHVAGIHSIPTSGPLPDSQTLEMRADLVGASQNDAWAGIHFLWEPELQGYLFCKDQDEVALMKFWNGASSHAWFFYENRPLKNRNVTLVLALTRRGSDLEITTRILDKDNANAVLFERTVTDTPQADPVLPNRAVRGALSGPDLPGTPWAVAKAPTDVELTLTWVNSQAAPQPLAEVIFDNLEVWQYESPQLAIRNAVVLSWPLTQGQFVLESAPSVSGPWDPVTDAWWRTNAGQCQVSVLAPASMTLFRLHRAGFPSYIPFDRAQGEIAEGVAVDQAGNVYVAVGGPGGPRNGQIWKLSATGERSVLVDFGTPGVTGLATDGLGNVYVTRDVAPNNGVFRVDPSGHAVRLPGTEQIVFPNSLAFDPEGSLFVTESFSFDPPLTPYAYTNYIAPAFGRGGIWRIPPQGSAELWLRDDLLSGTGSLAFLLPYPCGANGIGYFENALYIANTERSLVLRIPVLPGGAPGTIETVAQVPDPDPSFLAFGPPVPDGLALDVQGNIYVPVINRNAVIRINADGNAWATLATVADRLDAPASLAFGTTLAERTSLFVTSLSFVPGFAGPSLIKLDAGIPGWPLP